MSAESPVAARKSGSARKTEPGWKLVADAVGGPAAVAGKLRRLVRTMRLWRAARANLVSSPVRVPAW